MASIQVPGNGEPLAANGSTAGVLTVVASNKYYVGATAWLSDNTGTRHQRVIITAILTSTTIQVRNLVSSGSDVSNLNYQAGSDESAYTTANIARIDMPAQVVDILAAFSAKTQLN